ncbi:MAG: hypothetical protein IPM39_11680 [Chloroflexi bacterium]|nr:hypothetical protein [Chloroflexota bacterium]
MSRFIQHLGELTEKMPDKRAGRHNQIYALQDAVRGAFSIFSCKALLSGASTPYGAKARAE